MRIFIGPKRGALTLTRGHVNGAGIERRSNHRLSREELLSEEMRDQLSGTIHNDSPLCTFFPC